MLYIVSTPIGNLADITFRAIEVLKTCDYIICEDTRISKILCEKYAIRTPLISFHTFNEKYKTEKILPLLQSGQDIALISDAGTPLISDPGETLIDLCISHNIPFTTIPGPCSIISALSLSGFSTQPFQFVGFFPKKPLEKEKMLLTILCYPGTTIGFESPKRILETLKILNKISPLRNIALAKEMTKIHEEILRGTSRDLIDHLSRHSIKGEMVLVMEEYTPNTHDLSVEELVQMLQKYFGLSLKEAIRTGARIKKSSTNDIYKIIHHLKT